MPIYPDEIVQNCDVYNAYSYENSSCVAPFECKDELGVGETGQCQALPYKLGPETHTHNINTNFTLGVGGLTIPLVVTNRVHSHTFSREMSIPTDLKRYSNYYVSCKYTDAKYTATISEDCSIEKSTLHYLDITNGVCLYRYAKESVKFSATSSETADVRAGGVVGNIYKHHKIVIPQVSGSSYANGIEEWRLIVNGTQTVISSVDYPIAAMPTGNDGYQDLCTTPATTKKTIFVFPWLGSQDIMRDQECLCSGWYEYRGDLDIENTLNDEDGGYRDMFYPSWCRTLHSDPFWYKARDQRLAASYSENDNWTYSDQEYKPEISVDPIPLGSFAKHPKLGELYQFLTTDKNGDSTITESQDLTNKLKELVTVSGYVLIYPIGLM